MNRTGPDNTTEESLRQLGHSVIAGIDEAGRGCLAGPVAAAAVVLPENVQLGGLDDSKKLLPAVRARLETEIKQAALAWHVAWCSPAEIDRLNILHAAMEAMRRSAAALSIAPDAFLIDGNRSFPNPGTETLTLVSGDARSISIAAASILAKTARDRLMVQLGREFPMFGWARNKGYPTQEHYNALATHGPTRLHRRTFRLVRPRPTVLSEA